MAYDRARAQIVMFGGDNGKKLAETWVWGGSNWTQLQPATSPAGRMHHVMAYDEARQRIVLFGGFDGKNDLGDTWTWDGSTWSQKIVSAPTARQQASMKSDAVTRTVLLFGGQSNNGPMSDTWLWDGSKWTPLLNVTKFPRPKRYGAMFAADPDRGRLVLFGGYDGSNWLNDTWEWDGFGWSQLTPTTTSPTARLSACAVYDPVRQRVLMFGGDSHHSMLRDTWEYGTMTRMIPFADGCGTPPVDLAAVVGSLPIIGKTFVSETTNAPVNSTAAVMSLGVSRKFLGPLPLPLNLTSFYMPGCKLYTSYDALFFPARDPEWNRTVLAADPQQRRV